MIPSLSIWSAVPLPPYAPFPGGTLHADVAVIGGGFAGLSAAYHLLAQWPGARVIVLEAGRIGAGASGRTTGMLGPGVGSSLSALVRGFGPACAQALYRATLRAVQQVCQLVVDERIDCELQISGQLIVARGPAGRDRLAAQAALLRQLELPGEPLDNEALDRTLRLAPSCTGDRRRPGLAALRLPNAGTLHPVRLLGGLAACVTARGGQLFEGARVTGIGRKRPVRLAIHGGGEVLAEQVVVATAGYTPGLGLLRGRLLPLHLQVVVTDPMDDRTRQRIGWSGREGVLDSRRIFNYFRLTADDRIVFGGGAPRYRWAGRTADDLRSRSALDQLAVELTRTFPAGSALRVAGGWTGVIGYTLDGLPIIQRLRDHESVLQVVGWCGHGVALALASGAWVAHLLLSGAPPEDLPWYRDRPPLVPFELVRWLGFRAAVAVMSVADRLPAVGRL